MAKQFIISKANPIPFTQLVTLDDRYNSIPPSLARTPTTINGCYYQKWELSESTHIQFLSDYDVAIKVYKQGVFVADITPVEVVTSIKNQTFKCYEAEFDFSDYGNGLFYAEITFIDEDNVKITYQSEIWHTANKWPDTIVWEYRNAYNTNDGVIYETGFTPSFRVEGEIGFLDPKFDSEVYVDQIRNSTQLSGIPYKQYRYFTQYLPDWAIIILNNILNVSEKKADGEYYEKPEGAKWETTRVDGYEYASLSIELVPITNFFLQRLIIGDMADGDFVIYPKRLQWINNAVNRPIVGKFRVNTVLRRIDIVNKGGTAFTMNVGTTDGGNEIGSKQVLASDPTAVLLCLRMFDSDTTVYITGIDTAQTNLFVIYDQDDEAAISINGGSSTFMWPKGHVGYWTSSADELVTDVWDLASGLGKAGTAYSNCAICDGRNGTEDMLGQYIMGVETLTNIGDLLNTSVGSNTKTIAKANLPAEGLLMFADQSNGNPADKPSSTDKVAITSNYGTLGYEIHRSSIDATIGVTANLGSGMLFNVQPNSIRFLPYKAIS